MKNYSDSDYAVNKNAKGIVYRFVDGSSVVITIEDYLRENPEKNESDFNELKSLSDSDYLEQDRNDYRLTRKNVSFQVLVESAACSAMSSEEEVIDILDKAEDEKHQREKACMVLDKLTEKQRRRYLMYYVDRLTMRQIADIEGVNHSKIQKSLEAAKKKIQKAIEGC